MSLKQVLLTASLLPLLAGCDDEPERRTISLKLAGTSGQATVQYENGNGIQVLENQPLPVVLEFSAEVGETVRMYASVPNPRANLWILILEDGEIVESSTGCLCDGNFTSAEAGGVVGHW
jgi:hypothetical protein